MRPFIPILVGFAASAYAAPFGLEIGYNSLAGLKLWSFSKQAATVIDKEDKTIWTQLSDDPQYSKLVKLINYHKDIVNTLNEPSYGLTFFAVNNDAIPDHKKDKDSEQEGFSRLSHFLSGASDLLDSKEGDEDDEKHKIFLRILHAVLEYHIIWAPLSYNDLASNSTVASHLAGGFFDGDKSFDGQARRIRVEYKTFPLPATLELNGYSKILTQDIKASNGVIHTLDHPIIPGPSILDTLFLVPSQFSTITSSVQKVGLDSALQYHFVHDKPKTHGSAPSGSFKGSPSLTFFVPTNDAFNKLPEKLRFWLFSPFGTQALRKLLEFHIVENWIIHSEWIHQVSSSSSLINNPNDFDVKIQVPTILADHFLPIHIVKKPSVLPWQSPSITFTVNGLDEEGLAVPRVTLDGVARNGAWHAIPEVLDPRGRTEPGEAKVASSSGWEDWESWFPQWAESC